MKPVLVIPLSIDALALTTPLPVVDPTADFSRLPWWDGQRQINPDVAWLSDEILSKPFHDRGATLEAGVHLHWALPDALTRGEHSTGRRNQAALSAGVTRAEGGGRGELNEIAFPAVPNRWLVVRTTPDDVVRLWIVESDFLHPEGAVETSTATVVPFLTENEVGPPFRFLGRKHEFGPNWREEGGTADFLSGYELRLTAVGYEPIDAAPPKTPAFSEITFAAFYPNCHSVFGFHDATPPTSLRDTRYEVIGWYSDDNHDALQPAKLAEARRLALEALSNEKEWKNQSDAGRAVEAWRRAVRQLYQWDASTATSVAASSLYFASIKFATDAQSAPEAPNFNPRVQVAVGNTGLEALSAHLAANLPNGPTEDQLEALHHAHAVQNRTADVGAKLTEARHEKSFTAVSGGSLWSVRNAQRSNSGTDAAPRKIPEQLAYMLSDLNDAERACDRATREIVSLRRQTYTDWQRYALSACPPAGTQYDYPDVDEVRHFIERNDLVPLQRRLAGLSALESERDRKLHALRTEISKGDQHAFVLHAQPAPRYWQPRNPVLLVAGEALKQTLRHGQDGRASDDGTLACMAVGVPDGSVYTQMLSALQQLRNAETGQAPFGSRTWSHVPWNPFATQWEAELLADADHSAAAGSSGELTGSALLSAHARVRLNELTEEFIESQQGALSPVTRALKDLVAGEHDHIQTHALSGFNELLLAQKQCMQLPIDEPLALPSERDFVLRVRKAVGNRGRMTPLAFNDFRPIRAGTLQLLAVRLIDTFGRSLDLDWSGKVVVASSLSHSDAPGRICLPKRIVQPARLDFRWLSASKRGDDVEDELETNAHPATTPICGWLVSYMSRQLVFLYDGMGMVLGVLKVLEDGTWKWADPPGQAAVAVEDIENPDLRMLVRHLTSLDAADVALFIRQEQDAVESIHPDHFAQLSAPALLYGRPLAIVRASLKVSLRDPPATSPDWHVFRQEIGQALSNEEQGKPGPIARFTSDFERQPWPIRLGATEQLDDGLVGYWLENGDAPTENRYYAQPFRPATSEGAVHEVHLAPADAPCVLTLLIDPRAPVHAYCDALPAKAIGIPPSHFIGALESMMVAFYSGPLLAPPGAIHASLPAPAGFGWSFWSERNDGHWERREVSAVHAAAPPSETLESASGWFTLSKTKMSTGHSDGS